MVRAVQMDNLNGFIGIKRVNILPNGQVRDLSEVKKRVDEKN